MKNQINQTMSDFLKASYYGVSKPVFFQGDGKYYLTYRDGSKTYYAKAQRFLNADEYEVIETGNDAPRGGKHGEFEVVKFTEKFYEKYGWFLEAERKRVERMQRSEANAAAEFERQVNEFKAWAAGNQATIAEFEQRMKERTAPMNSSDRYNKSKMMKSHLVDRTLGTNSWASWKIYDAAVNC